MRGAIISYLHCRDTCHYKNSSNNAHQCKSNFLYNRSCYSGLTRIKESTNLEQQNDWLKRWSLYTSLIQLTSTAWAGFSASLHITMPCKTRRYIRYIRCRSSEDVREKRYYKYIWISMKIESFHCILKNLKQGSIFAREKFFLILNRYSLWHLI